MSVFPWLLVAGQAALVSSVMLARSNQSTFFASVAERAAATPAATSVLLTDTGFGRGMHGAVMLAAVPDTRLWMRPIRDLGADELRGLPGHVRHFHLIVSPFHPDSMPALRAVHAGLRDAGWIAAEVRPPYFRYLRADDR